MKRAVIISLLSISIISSAVAASSKLNKVKQAVNSEVGITQDEYNNASSVTTRAKEKSKAKSSSTGTKTTASRKTSRYYETDYSTDVTSLVILEPKGQNLDRYNEWFLSQIQTQLIDNFTLLSPITISDRQNSDEAQKEIELQENGTFSESFQGAIFGEAVGAEYMLTGHLADNGRDFSLSLRINNITRNTTVTSFTQKCNAADIKNGKVAADATKALLEELGIRLTGAGLEKLYATDEATQKRQENLSKGINASKRGTSIEAMQYYYAAAEYSTDDEEIKSRLNSMQLAIQSGNLGDQAAAGKSVYNSWLNELKEAEDYFRRNPPYEIIYDPEPLNVTNLLDREDLYDARNDLVKLPFKIGAIASTSARNTILTTQKAIAQLPVTIRKEFDHWPDTPAGNYKNTWLNPGNFSVEVRLLNENDRILSSKIVSLSKIGPDLSDDYAATYSMVMREMKEIYFENIRGSEITDVLTISFASIIYNGQEISTENIRISTIKDIKEPLMVAQKLENERQKIIEKNTKAQKKIEQQEIKKQQIKYEQKKKMDNFISFNHRLERDTVYWTFDFPFVQDRPIKIDNLLMGTTVGFTHHIAGPLFFGGNASLLFQEISNRNYDSEYIFGFDAFAEAGLNYTFPSELLSFYAKYGIGYQMNYISSRNLVHRIAVGADLSILEFEYSYDFLNNGDAASRFAFGFTISL